MLVLGALAPLMAAAPAKASGELGLSRFGAIIADPSTGRVFVSGDDKVVARNADGSDLATLTGLPGAAGMSVDGTSLWVVESTAAAISRYDLTTLTRTGRFPTGVTMRGAVEAVGDYVWFLAGQDGHSSALWRLDPATGDVSSRGSVFYGYTLERIPGNTTRLLVADAGLSPYSVYLVDLTTNPAKVLGDVDHGVGSNLHNVVATDHDTFITASGAPYAFYEFSTSPEASLLNTTGVVYPAAAYPEAIAYSPAFGGVIVGATDSSNKLWVARQGVPVSTHTLPLPGDGAYDGVAVSNDGMRAYAVTSLNNAYSLTVFDLTASITTLSKTSVVAHATSTIDVTGPGMTAASAVRLAGVSVPFIATSTGLQVEIDTNAAPGTVQLEVDTPFGQATKPMTVVADKGSDLTGTITSGSLKMSRATVTVSGDEIQPRTTSTNSDGYYAFTGLPADGSYALTVTHDVRRATVRPFELRANAATNVSVDLASPPAATPELRSRLLPNGQVRDIEFDSATNRLFVSVGNAVDVFDSNGTRLKRIPSEWGASGMAIVDGTLYVNLWGAGAVSIIDTTSMTEVRRLRTKSATTGTLAFAGGRIWVSDGDDQWVGAVAIDPASGDISRTAFPYFTYSSYETVFGNVEDDPDHFLASTAGLSPAFIDVMDGSTVPPTKLATNEHGSLSGQGDPVGSTAKDRVWPTSGKEFKKSTMKPTGIQYPAGNYAGVAHTTARGGLLMFSNNIVREGNPCTIYTLPGTPVSRGVALHKSGDLAYIAGTDGRLHTYELAPRILDMSIDLTTQPPSLTLRGMGFGCEASVKIDGSTVNFSADGNGVLRVSLPTLSAGLHGVSVETSLGTTQALSFNLSPPAIDHLAQTRGPSTGGTVRIIGSGFAGATSVSANGIEVDFTVESDGAIVATLPAHAPGAVDLVVTTPSGVSAAKAFTFADPINSGRLRLGASESLSVPADQIPVTGDFSGDGVDDIFWYGVGTAADSMWTFAPNGTHTTKAAAINGTFRPLSGDFTGDGVDDIFWYAPGSGADYLQDFNADGTSSFNRRDVNGTFQPVTGDFTGDGVDDIFWYGPGTAPDLMWDFNPDGGYTAKSLVVNGVFQALTGDFSGDGVDDIFWYAPGAAADYLQSFTKDAAPAMRQMNMDGSYQPFAGDFTGDGADDIFWFAPGTPADAVWDFESSGTHTESVVSRTDRARPAVGDFTGGGVDDIVWSNGASSAIWFLSPVIR